MFSLLRRPRTRLAYHADLLPFPVLPPLTPVFYSFFLHCIMSSLSFSLFQSLSFFIVLLLPPSFPLYSFILSYLLFFFSSHASTVASNSTIITIFTFVSLLSYRFLLLPALQISFPGVSGVLPRSREPTVFYNRSFSINNRLLKSICTEEGIDFINCWDDFYNKSFLFKNAGLHLDLVGAARPCRLLGYNVSDFRIKTHAASHSLDDVTDTLHREIYIKIFFLKDHV